MLFSVQTLGHDTARALERGHHSRGRGRHIQRRPPRAGARVHQQRKGFIKAAIQAKGVDGGGVDLVPVYHFHSALLTPLSPVSDAVARKLRAAIIWPAGVAGLPIPRANEPVLSVVGEAIKVKQESNPSQETIDAVHARFVASLRAAFDGHKHLAGPAYAKKELEVV